MASVFAQSSKSQEYFFSFDNNQQNGHKNSFELFGNPKFSAGVIGNCLDFDGIDDYATLGKKIQLDYAKGFTLGCWINPQAFNAEEIKRNAIINNAGSNNGVYWGLFIEDSKLNSPDYTLPKISFSIAFSNGKYYQLQSNTHVELHNWYYVVVSVKGTKIKLYVNGELENEINIPKFISGQTENNINLACLPFDSKEKILPDWIKNDNVLLNEVKLFSYNGLLDELKIYCKELSVDEVLQNYHNLQQNSENIELSIEVFEPQATRGMKIASKEITIKGKVEPSSKVEKFTINSREVKLDLAGEFAETIKLVNGVNDIELIAYGKDKSVKQKIISLNAELNKTIVKNEIRTGKYYALFIAVQNYVDKNINSLDAPIKDAEKIANVLTKFYTFDSKDIILLKNPTYDSVIKSLENLTNKLTGADNLLIFYAGHGVWEEQFSQGYWLPSDATKNSKSKWISNSTIKDFIKGIKARHTLLIADACFSGGIFKTRSIADNISRAVEELNKLSSRKAMTSGTLTEVPDKSVFVDYLTKRLTENNKKFISSEELYFNIKEAVINNSVLLQIPQFGEIRETGDEGGDFIFRKR